MEAFKRNPADQLDQLLAPIFDIADVKNAGGRPAGSISAGWFLREFVEGFPWAHLDVAGTAYTDREDATRVKGPTGIGVRLFSEFVLNRSGGAGATKREG